MQIFPDILYQKKVRVKIFQNVETIHDIKSVQKYWLDIGVICCTVLVSDLRLLTCIFRGEIFLKFQPIRFCWIKMKWGISVKDLKNNILAKFGSNWHNSFNGENS